MPSVFKWNSEPDLEIVFVCPPRRMSENIWCGGRLFFMDWICLQSESEQFRRVKLLQSMWIWQFERPYLWARDSVDTLSLHKNWSRCKILKRAIFPWRVAIYLPSVWVHPRSAPNSWPERRELRFVDFFAKIWWSPCIKIMIQFFADKWLWFLWTSYDICMMYKRFLVYIYCLGGCRGWEGGCRSNQLTGRLWCKAFNVVR